MRLLDSFNNAQHDMYAAQQAASQAINASLAAHNKNVDLERAIRSDNRKIVAFKEVLTSEDMTWAIMEGYVVSISHPHIFFKYGVHKV